MLTTLLSLKVLKTMTTFKISSEWCSQHDDSHSLLVTQWSICHLSQYMSWWSYQMETFSMLLAICVGNSPVPGEFPTQRPVTWSFDVFFDLCLNKRLSKQWWGWWFEMLSRTLWRRHNDKHFSCFQIGSIHLWCRIKSKRIATWNLLQLLNIASISLLIPTLLLLQNMNI